MKNQLSFPQSMFRKKPIGNPHADPAGGPGLKRVLGPFDLILMGIGGIIGTGVFVLSGVAAGLHAGNALPLSFLIAGIACIFAALCYAEFATMIPVAGSAYTYSYTALGEIWAWIIGWDLILEYGLAISAVAIGWSGYLSSLMVSCGIILPPALVHPPGTEGGIINLPAILIILGLTILLMRSTKKSAAANAVIVAIKLAVILFFIILGAGAIQPGNWQPFLPPSGMFGVISGAAIVFFALIGFDAVVTAAEEIDNPQKTLPIGIIGSLVICIILYVIVGFVLTGIVPWSMLSAPEAIDAPIAFALNHIGMPWGAALISVGALCGMTSVLLIMLFGQSRILFAMSRDGLVPAVLSAVNPKTQTPANVTLLTGICTALIAGLFPLTIVAELVNIGTLAAFLIVALSIIVLRYKQPDILRPFRCPAVPLIPILCIVTCLVLICYLNPLAHILFAIWLVIGLVIYFLYGIRNSNNRASGVIFSGPVPVTLHPGVPGAPAEDIIAQQYPPAVSCAVPENRNENPRTSTAQGDLYCFHPNNQ